MITFIAWFVGIAIIFTLISIAVEALFKGPEFYGPTPEEVAQAERERQRSIKWSGLVDIMLWNARFWITTYIAYYLLELIYVGNLELVAWLNGMVWAYYGIKWVVKDNMKHGRTWIEP